MPRFGYLKTVLFSLVCLLMLARATNAQSPAPTPTLILPSSAPVTVAGQSTLYCAGYIRHQKLSHMPEIVGAHEEQE